MFLNTHILSEPELYTFLCKHIKEMMDKSSSLNIKEIKKITYSSWHKRHNIHTDQMFHGHWNNLLIRIKQENSVCRALLSQAARYHFDCDDQRHIAVKPEKFSAWQNWLANQSGLPVIAFQLQENINFSHSFFERRILLKNTLGYRSIISPYNQLVEDYIEREGLNESHMHLNGTTSMEAMWHFSLCNPNVILEEIESQFLKNDRVQLLYSSSRDFKNPRDFHYVLLLARHLRQLLISWIQNKEDTNQYKHIVHDILMNKDNTSGISTNDLGFSMEYNFFGDLDVWTHITEIDLNASIIYKLKESSVDIYDACYLLYLLCMNCFQKILVQRDDQFGFDQFQKFADDGIREAYEKEYIARFYQLHGPNSNGVSDLLTLEGRFAPKNTQQKNVNLISSILRGFICYSERKEIIEDSNDLNILAAKVSKLNRPKLRLVAHFIKKPWRVELDNNLDTEQEPHFHKLREELRKNADLLFNLLESNPELRNILTGVDAAANEIETPPEVFAVLFRNCRRKRINNYTYHVGEDFEHLLSGIRAIFEAVTFLNLRNGDRIGHATAIGIDPNIWISKMPDSLFLRQGQWLENLLFLRHIALSKPTSSISLSHIESEIHELSLEIFGTQHNINTLQMYFSHRDIDPNLTRDIVNNNENIYCDWLQKEYILATQVHYEALKILYSRWFDKKTIKNFEKMKEISISSTSYQVLLFAQQYVQGLIVDRRVIIETLPTSNVRISHYNNIKDHHVFRWIAVPDRKIKGDHRMIVSLGSDDPGIFVTDLRNEFYHLFCSLVCDYSYSEHNALEEISRLNENGRVYRFDGPQN